MASGWRYYLANSRSMDIIGQLLNAHDRDLDVDLNKSGTANCWIPITHPQAGKVSPWETCLQVYFDDEMFWSGPVAKRSTDMASGRVTINAIGWFDRLMLLTLQVSQGVPYVDQDAGAIIADLVSRARAMDPLLEISMGQVATSQIRTITYQIDQSIGQAIIDLTNLEAGVDWYVDPVTRELSVAPKLGSDKPGVSWRFIGDGKAGDSNLANCVEDVDGTTVRNEIRPHGRVGSGFAEDTISKSRYGVFQEAPSLSNVADRDILNAFANAEIVYKAQPRVTYTMTPKPSSKANVPRLFRDFNIGDTLRLTAKRGFIDVEDQHVRIFGVSLKIRDNGVEELSRLQTTAS